MEKLHAAQKAITEVFQDAWNNGDYFPTEFQPELNDKTRQLIAAYAEQHGQAWLGNINLYGDDRGKAEKILFPLDQFVCNFAAAFIVPAYDQELVDLIYERDIAPYTGTKDDSQRIDVIFNRIDALGGLSLHWV